MAYSSKYSRKPQRRSFGWLPVVGVLLAMGILAGMLFLMEWSKPGQANGPGTITFTDPPDRLPPEISGVQDHLIYAGQTLDLLAGVSVADDLDPAPALHLDTTGLDITTAGHYEVTYIATDAAGNRLEQRCQVTVML